MSTVSRPESTDVDRRDGHDAAGPTRSVDPRAVRVALAPSLAHVGLAPLTVEPPPMPLAPRPSVVGIGILGGQAPAPDPEEDTGPGAADPSMVIIDGEPVGAALTHLDPSRASLRVGSTTVRVLLEPVEPALDGRGPSRREVIVDGWRVEVELESERRAALRDRARRGREASAHGGPTEVHAIIPGRIVSVSVVPGDEVVAGQQLLVVEAMKMQNELRAPRDGTISRVAATAGLTIEIGDLLLVLE